MADKDPRREPPDPEREESPKGTEELADALERHAEIQRGVLAEAERHRDGPGSGEVQDFVLQLERPASDRPAVPGRRGVLLQLAGIAAAAAAAGIVWFSVRSDDSGEEDDLGVPLGGGEGLELLAPVGEVREFSAFRWQVEEKLAREDFELRIWAGSDDPDADPPRIERVLRQPEWRVADDPEGQAALAPLREILWQVRVKSGHRSLAMAYQRARLVQ